MPSDTSFRGRGTIATPSSSIVPAASGAVRADEPVDLALLERKAETAQRLHAAKGDVDAVELQDRYGRNLARDAKPAIVPVMPLGAITSTKSRIAP